MLTGKGKKFKMDRDGWPIFILYIFGLLGDEVKGGSGGEWTERRGKRTVKKMRSKVKRVAEGRRETRKIT